jgi:hypothetical protein
MSQDLNGTSEEKSLDAALSDLERFVKDVQGELLPHERKDGVRRLDAIIEKLLP